MTTVKDSKLLRNIKAGSILDAAALLDVAELFFRCCRVLEILMQYNLFFVFK